MDHKPIHRDIESGDTTQINFDRMKIVSWNLYCGNLNQIAGIDYILTSNPDVVCLQEASQSTVDYLKSLAGWDIEASLDFHTSITRRGKKQPFFIVTMVSRSITLSATKSFSLEGRKRRPIISRIKRWESTRDWHWVDVCINNRCFRIFNIHLEVAAGPKLRLQQMYDIFINLSSENENIICGDFNIFARPLINVILGWLFGFKLSEYLINERTIFENLFEQENLMNPFRGKTTFPRARLQLDHILIPSKSVVTQSNIWDEGRGSDHLPISVELDLA